MLLYPTLFLSTFLTYLRTIAFLAGVRLLLQRWFTLYVLFRVEAFNNYSFEKRLPHTSHRNGEQNPAVCGPS